MPAKKTKKQDSNFLAKVVYYVNDDGKAKRVEKEFTDPKEYEKFVKELEKEVPEVVDLVEDEEMALPEPNLPPVPGMMLPLGEWLNLWSGIRNLVEDVVEAKLPYKDDDYEEDREDDYYEDYEDLDEWEEEMDDEDWMYEDTEDLVSWDDYDDVLIEAYDFDEEDELERKKRSYELAMEKLKEYEELFKDKLKSASGDMKKKLEKTMDKLKKDIEKLKKEYDKLTKKKK